MKTITSFPEQSPPHHLRRFLVAFRKRARGIKPSELQVLEGCIGTEGNIVILTPGFTPNGYSGIGEMEAMLSEAGTYRMYKIDED